MGPLTKTPATATKPEGWSIDLAFVRLLHEKLQRGTPATLDCTLQLVRDTLKLYKTPA